MVCGKSYNTWYPASVDIDIRCLLVFVLPVTSDLRDKRAILAARVEDLPGVVALYSVKSGIAPSSMKESEPLILKDRVPGRNSNLRNCVLVDGVYGPLRGIVYDTELETSRRDVEARRLGSVDGGDRGCNEELSRHSSGLHHE